MNKINENLENLTSEILIANDMFKIPVDLIKIANNYNIDVYESDLEDKISGAIKYYCDEDKFAILLNKKENNRRRRIIFAHEIGHYILHFEILKSEIVHVDILHRISEQKDVDYFAGALLMNRSLLKKVYMNTTSIKELAEIFEVSESAMTVRLDILGLI